MNERIIEKEEANKDSQFSVVDINSVCMFMKMWISTYLVFFKKKTNSDIHEKMKFNRFNVYFYRGNNSNFTAY